VWETKDERKPEWACEDSEVRIAVLGYALYSIKWVAKSAGFVFLQIVLGWLGGRSHPRQD
jgi:hypothetical protein